LRLPRPISHYPIERREKLRPAAYVDPNTGRPDTQIQIVSASYQLIELATGKIVLNDVTYVQLRTRCPADRSGSPE
jgi:hypothetical protein